MHTVSVLIPVYNRKETLVRAIRSALKQTRLPDEIVVADDASDFNVREYLAKEYPEIASRIQVIRGEVNQGVSGARNMALCHSSGDLIALLDSDDYWEPEKVAKQLAVLERTPAVDIVSCRQWIVRNGQKAIHEKKLYQENLFEHLLTDWHAPNPSTLLIKREHLETIPFNENMRNLEDLDWWLRFSLLKPTVHYVDEPLMYYCIDESNRLSYVGYRERFSRVAYALQHWKPMILQEKGKKAYHTFKRSLTSYHAIDAFVACARRRDFLPMLKILLKYLWNDRKFYQLIFEKVLGLKSLISGRGG